MPIRCAFAESVCNGPRDYRVRLPHPKLPAPDDRTVHDVRAELSSRANPKAANQFVAARNEFANVFGDLARGKRNWQLVAFALSGVLIALAIANLRLVTTARVVPYIVQQDRLGQIVAVGTAERMIAPEQRLIASQLAQFIRAVRTVLPATAGAAQGEMIRRAYAFAAPEAVAFLNQHFADARNDPRALGLRLTRQVQVTGVLVVPKSDVWRIRWEEIERPSQLGGLTRTTEWEGYFAVKLIPPANTERIEDNPLGIYITSISWTQLAESSSPAAEGHPAAVDSTHDRGAGS